MGPASKLPPCESTTRDPLGIAEAIGVQCPCDFDMRK
jgi:hypothetical protein